MSISVSCWDAPHPYQSEVSVEDHEVLLTTFWRQRLTQACPRSQCVAGTSGMPTPDGEIGEGMVFLGWPAKVDTEVMARIK